MAPSVDAAIIKALDLDSNQTNIASYGGSGFASTFKLSITTNGQVKNYFIKTSSGKNAGVMFRG